MAIEIKIPQLGESVTEATIGTILKPTGTMVSQDEEIIEIETVKVNQVLYAPASGVITWHVKSGDTFAIGHVIGSIQESGIQESSIQEAQVEVKPEVQEAPPVEVKVAPTVSSPSSETKKPMSQLRKAIATRLVKAQSESASLTTFNEVDMSEIMKLREQYKETFMKAYGVKLGLMSFFVKAATSALKAFPEVNAYIDKDMIVQRNYIDISIAVATEKGLFVPVLRNCDSLTFSDIEKQIADLADRAKQGKISMDELKGGCFTITNGGIFGSLLSTPILNPPQCAILGMHTIKERPVVVNSAIVIRPMMYLALTYDHRLLDGREAILFLNQIKNCLEDPHRLELGI